jgi:hypothetical protein
LIPVVPVFFAVLLEPARYRHWQQGNRLLLFVDFGETDVICAQEQRNAIALCSPPQSPKLEQGSIELTRKYQWVSHFDVCYSFFYRE